MERKIIICWAALVTGLLLVNSVFLFKNLKTTQIGAAGLGELGVKNLIALGEVQKETKVILKKLAFLEAPKNESPDKSIKETVEERQKEIKSLSGIWKCNDGGTYYVKTEGDEVYWVGESGDGGKSWSNLFIGKNEAGQIQGKWLDFPKGKNRLKGNLVLKPAEDYMSLRYINGTGGFGGRYWEKTSPQSATYPQ